MSKFEEYKDKGMDRYEAIFKKLNIEYEDSRGDVIRLKCPIHGSDKMGNSVIYKNSGIWMCFSGECHNNYPKNILGLIKGALKSSSQDDSYQSIFNLIDGISEVCPIQKEIREPVDLFKDESSKPPITIPSLYFMKRGYSGDILTDYGVGDCSKSPFDNRAIIPVRYINGEYMGFTSRIHWNECPECKYHHSKYTACISSDYDFHFMYRKSYHSKGLQKSKTLYGIEKVANRGLSKVAIVEGPGCVWKLAEYGISALSCLGKDFSKLRLKLLENLNIKNVLFIPDKDKAGEEFKNRFIRDYSGALNIFLPYLTQKDVGEMSDEDIKQHIVRKWESI